VGAALAEQVPGHVAGGQPELVADGQHHVGVVLADAVADRRRLGCGGRHAGEAVAVAEQVRHRVVDEGGGLLRASTAGLRRDVGRHIPQPPVGSGQRGRAEQPGAVQGGRGQQQRAVVVHPLDHRGEPELDHLGDPLGPQQGDDVAVHVALDPAAGLSPGHLEPVRPPVLAAVARRRHDHQPLPQLRDRRVVLVAEALLEDVADPPGRTQVEAVVVEQGGAQHRGVETSRPRGSTQQLHLLMMAEKHFVRVTN
jgi:hypothetical protein